MGTAKIGNVTDFFSVIEPLGDFMLTKFGGIIGGFELSGIDPDGLDSDDHIALSFITRAIYGRLPKNISISQYYIHYDGVKTELRKRDDVRFDVLSKRREEHLNKQNLSTSRIFHLLEVEPDADLNNLDFLQTIKHVGNAVFNASSRKILKNKFSNTQAVLRDVEVLSRNAMLLQDTIKEVQSKWDGLFRVRVLNNNDIWALMRFLASGDPEMLRIGLKESVPDLHLDIYVSAGDMDQVNNKETNVDVMKIHGISNRYVRVGRVRHFSSFSKNLKNGIWATEARSPVRLHGNYAYMVRWKPYSEFERSMMFMKKRTELERQKLSIFEMMKGGEGRSELERQAGLRPALKQKLEELGKVEGITDVIGSGESFVMLFGDNVKDVRNQSLEVSRAISSAGINMFWESVGLVEAFTSIQPGQRRANEDYLYMTSSQLAAVSLIHQSSEGQMTVPDLGNEEAQYMLNSKDGQLFGYSPFVGGRAMVIGVGPIRSGKTFSKNTMAMHFLKYGGLYRAIDIDPGSELIAQSLQGDKGVFKVGHDSDSKGFNPFSSYMGRGDRTFKAHFNNLLLEMLKANDAPEDRIITPDEQRNIDYGMDAMLDERFDKKFLTLSHFVSHLDASLERKFRRWVRNPKFNGAEDGRYAHLFDADHDAIGDLKTPIGVFNLNALRDDQRALRPVMLEIFYRITQMIEDPATRHLAKQLDVDEAHYLLSIPYAVDYLVSKVRTWGKFFGSINMWSQSVKEFGEIEGWEAIRSAATTFWFMADPAMDKQKYQEVFGLSDGQCEAIRSLVPKREAFLYQPELGVSKIVVFDVELEQAIMNTSHPREASIRDVFIRDHGFEYGMKLAVEHFEKQGMGQGGETKLRSVA